MKNGSSGIWFLTAGVLAVTAIAQAAAQFAAAEQEFEPVKRPIPAALNFTVKDIDGKSVNPARYAGLSPGGCGNL